MYKFKSHLMSMLAIAGMAFMTSCGSDGDPEPEKKPNISLTAGPTLTATDANMVGGTAFQTGVIATSGTTGRNLKSFKVTVSYDGAAPVTILDSTGLTGETFTYTYNGSTRFVAGKEKYTFTITDRNDLSSSQSFTITTTDPNAGAQIDTYTAVLLGAQSNSTTGSFFATNNGTVMLQSQAKANAANVDFVYYYGVNNKATVAAPNEAGAGTIFNNASTGLQTWSVRNATKFKVLGSAPADDVTFASASTATALQDAYANAVGGESDKANMLAPGMVVAFKTGATTPKYGMFKVTGGAVNNTGTITLTVKVEQ